MIVWYDSEFGNVMAMMAMWGLKKIIVFISMPNNELYDTIQRLLSDDITCLLILVRNTIRVNVTDRCICIYAYMHICIHIYIYTYMHDGFPIMVEQVYTIECIWNPYLVSWLDMI